MMASIVGAKVIWAYKKLTKHFCCLHHQIFHFKKIVIVIVVVCSQTISIVAPINLNVMFSLSKLHKREYLISH